jgi:hypothetical protein
MPMYYWIYNPSYMLIYSQCGLVVRVPGHRSIGLRFDSQRYQILGLTEEKLAAAFSGSEINDSRDPLRRTLEKH